MTTTITNNTIKITKQINADDFFNAIIGSDFYGCQDYVVPRSLVVNEKNKSLSLKYYDLDNLDSNGYYKTLKKTLSLKKLANAYATLLQNNYTHCSNYALDVDDYDGCFGYLVIQQALYNTIEF
jgi:hypothetical protein